MFGADAAGSFVGGVVLEEAEESRSAVFGAKTTSCGGAGVAGAHLQIISDLRSRLSDATGAEAALSSDVGRLSSELAEKHALVIAHGKRIAVLTSRSEGLAARIDSLVSDRIEDRRTIRELTNRSLQATAREEQFTAVVESWRRFASTTHACFGEYLASSAEVHSQLLNERKELLLLRAQSRAWPSIREMVRVCATIEIERDALRKSLDDISDAFASTQAAHADSLGAAQSSLMAAECQLSDRNAQISELERALNDKVASLCLPPLVVPASSELLSLVNSLPLISDNRGDGERSPAPVCPSLSAERSLRQSLEKQLASLLGAGLGRIERTAKSIVSGEDNATPHDGAQSVAADRFVALEERHRRLEASHAALQQRVVDDGGEYKGLRCDIQELQQYLVHVETELGCNGSISRTTVGALQSRTVPSNANCFVCQQQVPGARAVRCCRCPRVFHKSCCGFPQNEASFVCCAQTGHVRSRSGAVRQTNSSHR